MARVKNQSTWLDSQRALWKMWRKNISQHSQSAKDELKRLEDDYQIKTLMDHPERYEGSLAQIKEFMHALEDIQKSVESEKLYQRGGPRERDWKESKKSGTKKRGVRRGVRTVPAPLGIDPRTGEMIPIIDAEKGSGENVSGVTYRVDQMRTPGGLRYRFRITKSGRSIEPIKDPAIGISPPLYDHPDQKKLFKTPEEARLRARRVIHAALIWFEEHRAKIRERVRRAGHRKDVHETIQRSRQPGISRKLREEWELKQAKKKRLAASQKQKMLKGNPEKNPNELEKQAKASLAQYQSDFRIWERSFNSGRPNYAALMNAYDMLENARANLSIAGHKSAARSVQGRKEELKDAIIALMAATDADEIISAGHGIRSNPSNPPKSVHQQVGIKFLKKSGTCWNRYRKSLKMKDLLDTYEDLIIAQREFGYAKDKKGLAQARDGLKAARAELSRKKK